MIHLDFNELYPLVKQYTGDGARLRNILWRDGQLFMSDNKVAVLVDAPGDLKPLLIPPEMIRPEGFGILMQKAIMYDDDAVVPLPTNMLYPPLASTYISGQEVPYVASEYPGVSALVKEWKAYQRGAWKVAVGKTGKLTFWVVQNA